MSTTTDFLDGIIAELVAAGAGVYRENGPKYTAAETGIALNVMPDDPDTMIVLTSYQPGGDDANLPIGRLNLQVRTRGTNAPKSEMAIRDACYAALQGLARRQFGSVALIKLRNISSVPMGRDSRGRWEYASNYVANVDLPATANRNLAF